MGDRRIAFPSDMNKAASEAKATSRGECFVVGRDVVDPAALARTAILKDLQPNAANGYHCVNG